MAQFLDRYCTFVCTVAIETLILTEQFFFISDLTIILPIVQIKNTIDNVDRIFFEDDSFIIFGQIYLNFDQIN